MWRVCGSVCACVCDVRACVCVCVCVCARMCIDTPAFYDCVALCCVGVVYARIYDLCICMQLESMRCIVILNQPCRAISSGDEYE